jgi:hypothetical protein
MSDFDYGKALADMWALGGKTVFEAQQQALRAMRESAAAMGLPGAATPAVALPALWSSATALTGTLTRRLPKGMDPDSTVAATLRRMVDPRVWLSSGDDMEEALQRMAQGPRLADLWDTERRYAKVFQAWMTLRRRGLEHQAVVLEGWTAAARRFTERLGELAGKGETPASQRAALDLWIETANRALLEMQRSERYLASQAQILRASTELRLAQQEVAEYYGQMFGLPTRTELDDVHKSLTELRRELRATRRQLRAAQVRPSAAERPGAEVIEARPTRRSATAEG